MATPAHEQRHYSRVPFQANVRLTGHGVTVESTLLDISLKGALVQRPARWETPPGSELDLVLLLADSADLRIRMRVRVAHNQGDRVGLQCRHIDLDSITHLRQLVAANLGDAALLDRELAQIG